MKKEYMKPEMQVVTIKTQRQLLNTSTVDVKAEVYDEENMTDM